MTNQHPITPPPELVRQWCDPRVTKSMHFSEEDLATRAAQWGADQELEACLGKVSFFNGQALADRIRAVRRPKPPSLKEQALQALSHLLDGAAHSMDTTEPADYIRRALEQLPE